MAKKFRPVKFLFSISIIGIAGILILTSVTDNQSFGTLLEVPPNAIITFINDDGVEQEVTVADFGNPQIACWVWDRILIFDRNGDFTGQGVDSPFLKLNPPPRLSIADSVEGIGTNLSEGEAGFRINPSIKCSTSTGTFIDPQAEISEGVLGVGVREVAIPIIIEESDLVLRIYSSDKDNPTIFHDSFHQKVTTLEKRIVSGDEAVLDVERNVVQGLGTFPISGDTLEKFLEDGNYNSKQIVTLDGIINVRFDCSGACASFKYAIPLTTERVFIGDDATQWDENDPIWGSNAWRNVENDVLVSRTVQVVKNFDIDDPEKECNPQIENCGGTERPACEVNEIVQGNQCVPIVNRTCEEQGLVTFGNICVNPTTPPSTTGGTDIFSQLSTCIASGDVSCYTSPTFLPLWIGGLGFGVLIVGLAQTSPVRTKTTDIYGVPSSF